MKVLEVSATVGFAKALKDGSFKLVALSSGAQLEDGDDPSRARRLLYLEVAEDLKACFSNNGKGLAKEQAKKSSDPPPVPKENNTGKPHTKGALPEKGNNPKPETKMCPIHGVPMKRRTKDGGGAWWSHKDDTTEGKWCHGRAKNR